MHDDASLVLQPQIADSGRLEADLPGALDIGAGELGDVVELVDVPGDVELGDAARADHRADQLERIGLSLEGQRAGADARAPAKTSVMMTLPDGSSPAMLCAVGTSVGIGEDAQPANVIADVRASPAAARVDPRAIRLAPRSMASESPAASLSLMALLTRFARPCNPSPRSTQGGPKGRMGCGKQGCVEAGPR